MSSDIETWLAEVEKRHALAERTCPKCDAPAMPGPSLRGDIGGGFPIASADFGGFQYPHARTDIPRLVAELRKTRAAHDSVMGGLELLKAAIEAGDPEKELLLRVQDLIRDSREALEGNHD